MGTRKSAVSRFRTKWQYVASGVMLFAMALLVNCSLSSSPAFATQTAPRTINYQGRLTDTQGVAVPDGDYNMKFSLWGGPGPGGFTTWTEVREGASRVTVTNGQFSVRLGSVTAFSSNEFYGTYPLYLEVALPSTNATCATAGCATYDSVMSPRQELAASAYAQNADLLDGIDGSSFARTDASNSFSSTNTFTNTVYHNQDTIIGQANSSSKLVISNSAASVLFKADTSSMLVTLGSTTAASLANVRLLTTSAEFTGTVRIGTATDGVDISGANGILLSGTARRTRSIQLMPEYANAVLDAGSGSNNTGSMTSKLDLTNRRNYYKWTTTQATAQSYDVVVQVPIPNDFSAWASTTPISIDTYSSDTTNGTISIEARDTASAVVTGINFASVTPTAATAWQTKSAGTISGTYAAGGYMTLRIRMASPTGGDVRISNIKLDYLTKW